MYSPVSTYSNVRRTIVDNDEKNNESNRNNHLNKI